VHYDQYEALDMPAASGVPTTAIIIGDYSNGNDALLRSVMVCQMKDLPGKKLLLSPENRFPSICSIAP